MSMHTYVPSLERSPIRLKRLDHALIQPRTFSPMFNSVISYSDVCNPNPCKGSQSRNPSSTTRCGKRKNPCGPTKRGGGHDICYKRFVEQGFVDHDYKNMTLKRPMSPHLEIFATTIPAGFSIFQRITGVIVACYALLLSGGTLFLSNGIETYVSIIQSLDLGELTVNLAKLVLGLPFAYHYCNGIRYCLWNTARFLTLKDVYYTSGVVTFMCLVGAGAFAFFL